VRRGRAGHGNDHRAALSVPERDRRSIETYPVTPDRWDDRLFVPRGAVAGCWYMWWRLSSEDWKRKAYAGNHCAARLERRTA
jgi:hypothetical protein